MTNRKTLTQAMFETSCPYNNPYQGNDKRVLFVCSAGLLRSATAARIYAGKYNTRAAGSAEYALIPVTQELLLWADEVVFVNGYNAQQVYQKFDMDTFDCVTVELDIPDDYEHMHPELIKAFKEQYEDF
jgi:predicted protein tyrosine phosphatase